MVGNQKKERGPLQHIQWTPYLAIGISKIDDQHIELFNRFNNLVDGLTQEKEKEELARIVSFLGDYTINHFGCEEEAMTRYQFPATATHTAEHTAFKKDFALLKQRVESSGPSTKLAVELLQQMGDWLVRHVEKSDQNLGRFLKVAMMIKRAA
jgi:hemerythrin